MPSPEPKSLRSAPADVQAGDSPLPGLTLRSVLRGHKASINRIAWSPDGTLLASPSYDGTTRIWDVERGECVAALADHREEVRSVAWSPDGLKLAAVSEFEGLQIWDVPGQRLLGSLDGDDRPGMNQVAWSPDGTMLAVSYHRTVEVWDSDAARLIATSGGLGLAVPGLSWSPSGQHLAACWAGMVDVWNPTDDDDTWEWGWGWSPETKELGFYGVQWSHDEATLVAGATDGKIYLWEAPNANLRLVVEGHTGPVYSVSYSADGRLLATKSGDDTVRLWDTRFWTEAARIQEPNSFRRPFDFAGLAFHPRLPVLATLGERDSVIRIWDVDVDLLLVVESAPAESVRYTTAKLVLVGDSGVGKTGLGWRLARGEFKEHASTHGQQFWVIDELCTKRKDGTECEAVLWDLAGQPVYRPVHAIFLDDVDLSLVLFDPTNRAEPLKGAQFWLEQLAGGGHLPPTVLVGGRVDRGAAAVSREELEQFCQRYRISGSYVGTSAKSGEGLGRLLETVKAQIPWEQMTTTVTTVTFKRIKKYVLELKAKPDRRGVLVRPSELRAQLRAADGAWEFTDAEMMTAVGHLANHGYVSVLRSSSGAESVLLAPELLVDLASSIVLQADKHPRDLGALSETELLRGGYDLPELASLQRAEQQILLDAAVARFLSHNICFRETLGADALLIFPGLIKQKRPLFDEFETTDDVSYVVRGRVENVYAALVVLLGYTQTFTRVNQWQNQAQYQMGEGQLCGFRLIEEREGEIELVLYYSAAMPAYGRAMFQGLFEQFLYQRDVEVTRFPPVVCPNGHLQQRATVVNSLREGWRSIFCAKCGREIALPEIDKPKALGERESRSIHRAEALAHLRSTYESHLVRVKSFRSDRTPPRCLISHIPEQAAWVAQLARDLREAGVFVLEDGAQARPGDFILLAGSPPYRKCWDDPAGPLAADAALVRERLRQTPASWPTVIPFLLRGNPRISLPPELGDSRVGDFRDGTRYAVALFDLVLTLYVIPLDHPGFEPLRESLLSQWRHRLTPLEETVTPTVLRADATPPAEAGGEVFISYAWGGESEAVADELDEAFRERGVNIVRDKRDLSYKGRVREFMEGIGGGRCVILIIGDKYLRSSSCLFELVQVYRRGDFDGRVFPVVLEDARIYDPVERIGYVKHWERKRDALDAAMKDVSADNLQGFREEIDLYAEIRDLLPRLTDVLKDMNALTPEMHRGSDFEELFEAVMSRLGG